MTMLFLIILILVFMFTTLISLLLAKLVRLKAEKVIIDSQEQSLKLLIDIQAENVPFYTIILMVICALVGLLLTGNLVVSAILGVGGYFLPKFYFKRAHEKRREKLNAQLVEAIEMMANSLKAGSSLDSAIEMVCEEMQPPISQEFKMVLINKKLNKSTEKALIEMCDRIKSNEYDLVTKSIILGQQTGGNLIEVFNRIAMTIRGRQEMINKIETITAQGKMEAIFVGALPFLLGFVIYLMDPAMMRPMFTSLFGYLLIGIAIILDFIGVFFIRKILNIDI